jgi:hypothetical protein
MMRHRQIVYTQLYFTRTAAFTKKGKKEKKLCIIIKINARLSTTRFCTILPSHDRLVTKASSVDDRACSSVIRQRDLRRAAIKISVIWRFVGLSFIDADMRLCVSLQAITRVACCPYISRRQQRCIRNRISCVGGRRAHAGTREDLSPALQFSCVARRGHTQRIRYRLFTGHSTVHRPAMYLRAQHAASTARDVDGLMFQGPTYLRCSLESFLFPGINANATELRGLLSKLLRRAASTMLLLLLLRGYQFSN